MEEINLRETAVETSWGEPGFEMDSPNELATPENQLVLVLGYPPEYPQRALPLNIEGYVVVGFSVDQAGQVFDARVLESSPTKIFDRAALRAITKFRYKPRVVGGKPVVTANQRYKFVFELSD
jgi:protein TonB